ncbi:ribonuclease H2 subunit B, putative [Plasmodium relictum]|uniref:Ribonuclease H2 subunit B, putative n=1 Tax=Plasmodium relictum TaxID=85471 RepID=A0A1J1HH47_PLARL|nr:ribonuclease H2 subunit B, putative [Plasmodium relictum]CRH03801.1 ribonuclease H2 subunit B, putative [Plasmodium relictum]
MEDKNAFLFHIFNSEINENEKKEKVEIRSYSFIKLPSASEPSKIVLYHFNEEANELYLLDRNYYNPKIETIRHEKEKINKNYISIFINNYAIENNCSYYCYPIDALFIFISIIYENCTNNKFTTLENYLNNILKDNEKIRKEVIKNMLYILKKNVNKIKDRLKIVCDELYENEIYYYKPNIEKVKNFYNFKCIILFNYIIENKIIFPDYAQYVEKEILEKYKTDKSSHPLTLIKEEKKQIDKYNEYKKNVDNYLVEFNKKHYRFNGNNLRAFIWLIIKGFMCLSLEEKIVPDDICKKLKEIKDEEEEEKRKTQNVTFTKNKKHPLQAPRNQPMIDSFFKKKRIK